MAVSKEEELIEREKLKKTAQVLDDEITLLQKRTKILQDDLQDFKSWLGKIFLPLMQETSPKLNHLLEKKKVKSCVKKII